MKKHQDFLATFREKDHKNKWKHYKMVLKMLRDHNKLTEKNIKETAKRKREEEETKKCRALLNVKVITYDDSSSDEEQTVN